MTNKSTIDFDAMARRILEWTDLGLVRHQLVLIWNARGAADIAMVDVELSTMMGSTAAGSIVKTLDHALRMLDR